MPAPEGYKRLPSDLTCRGCSQTWQEPDGSYWCCGKSKTLAALENIAAFDSTEGRIAAEVLSGTR